MKSENKIAKVITKTCLDEEKSDFKYWQTKSYAERLAALEEIRQEFNGWKYRDAERRISESLSNCSTQRKIRYVENR